MREAITLTPDEIEAVTGYKRAADQLKALESRGFYRAFLRAGRVVLERAHYEAVCAGSIERARPKVKPPRRTA